MRILCFLAIAAALTVTASAGAYQIGEFQEPWKNDSTAIVIDAFEGNAIDWDKLASDSRVAGIIHRGTIGYRTDKEYFNRREKAKSRGYKWGSYHVGISDDPIKQADYYLQTMKPEDDEVIALDLESLDSNKFMNLAQAAVFINRIKEKTGRYPMIYGNYKSINKISAEAGKDNPFSKTALWYARYKPRIEDFPSAAWTTYTLWQFSCEINCKRSQLDSCAYLVPGTEYDMDVNVFNGTIDELMEEWPFSHPSSDAAISSSSILSYR